MPFSHFTVKKIVHGNGSIKDAAKEVKSLKGSRALIVTDPGLAKLNVQQPLEEALTAGGIAWELFAKAELEPSMDSIQACADAAKAFKADVFIGFGGGSALDTTKAAAVRLATDVKTLQESSTMGAVMCHSLPPPDIHISSAPVPT